MKSQKEGENRRRVPWLLDVNAVASSSSRLLNDSLFSQLALPYAVRLDDDQTSSEASPSPTSEVLVKDSLTIESGNEVNKKPSSGTKTLAKFRKAPQAPRRFKSAFIFFSTEKHKEIRAQLFETGVAEKTTNIAKLVSKAWGDLPPEKREKWDALARRDKTRYEMEKSKYTGPWKVPADRRALKDPNAPKRPMSAFLAFSNPRRGMVKQNNPEMDNSQISKALSRMWKDAPEQVRQKYINEEFTKRNRYKQVIMEWKKENDEQKRLDRQYQEDIALQAVDATEEQSTFAVTRTDSLRHQEDLNAAAYTITSYQPCEPMYQPFPSSRMGVYGNEDAGAIQSSGSAYCEQPGGVPGLSSTNHSLAHISNMLCRPQILSPFQQMQDSRSFLNPVGSLTGTHLEPRSSLLSQYQSFMAGQQPNLNFRNEVDPSLLTRYQIQILRQEQERVFRGCGPSTWNHSGNL